MLAHDTFVKNPTVHHAHKASFVEGEVMAPSATRTASSPIRCPHPQAEKCVKSSFTPISAEPRMRNGHPPFMDRSGTNSSHLTPRSPPPFHLLPSLTGAIDGDVLHTQFRFYLYHWFWTQINGFEHSRFTAPKKAANLQKPPADTPPFPLIWT